MMIADF